MKWYFNICVIVLLNSSVEAQSDSLPKAFIELVQVSKNINNGKLNFSVVEERKILKLLKKNNEDISLPYKDEIVEACTHLTNHAESPLLRRELARTILNVCDHDFNRTCNHGIILLRNLHSSDFDKSLKKTVMNRMTIDSANWDLILLAGFLELGELIPKIEDKLKSRSALYHPWYLHRFLARLGKREEIDYCIRKIDLTKYPNYRLLDEVLYIKQPELIDIYNFYLQSDAKEPGSYDIKPMAYAEIGARFLARLLEDFPLEKRTDSGSYTPAQITLARQWMLANKGKYKIRRDEF
jgi:hypothetical protein